MMTYYGEYILSTIQISYTQHLTVLIPEDHYEFASKNTSEAWDTLNAKIPKRPKHLLFIIHVS